MFPLKADRITNVVVPYNNLFLKRFYIQTYLTPSSASSSLTFAIFAFFLSILLIATMNGARACRIIRRDSMHNQIQNEL